MVLELAIAGQALDLSDDVRIRLVRTNPFFQDEITGEYTFPFNLPVTPTNAQILQYTHIPTSGGDRRRDYPAMLQAGPFSLVGTLQVREMSRKVYQANLIVPPGNIPAKTWNKKLQEFNLGSVTFPSKMKSTQHWVADIKGLIIGSVAQIELYDKNNAKLFSATYFPVVDPGGWDQVDLLEGYIKTASESNALKDREFVGFLQGDQMVFNLPPSETLGKIRFVYASPINRQPFEIPFTEIKYRTWADYQASDGVSNLMLADDRFKFPVIYNEDWYDSEQAKGWIKYVNYFQGALYRFNDPAVPTQYSLSPCLNLKWVLTQLFLQQGYRLESSFFDTYASLHLFNNKSLDEQVPGLSMPFNQFKDTIVFSEHLPDLSLKEFIEQLGVLFFHRWELDPILKVARFVPLSTIAEAGPVLDFTEQMVREYTIQASELTQHVFKFSVDSSDALAKDSIDETADAQAKASYQLFKSFPEKEDPGAERTQRHETSFSPLFQTITEEPATAAAPARTVYSSLQVKQRCISPLFKQEKTGMASPRLFFYAGIQEVTDLVNSEKTGSTATLKVPSGRMQTHSLKLVWSDIVERYGKTWLELLNNSFDLKVGMLLWAVDLARLTFTEKQHLSGLNYLPAEIDIELGKHGLKSTAVVTWKKA